MKNRSNIYTICSILMILIFMGIVVIRQKGLTTASDPVTMDFFAMDTVCSITIYDMSGFSKDRADEVLKDARRECERLEDLLSATKEGSDIYLINHYALSQTDGDSSKGPVSCRPETMEVLNKALDYCELSKGRFDVTIGAVSLLWDFHEEGDHRLPDEKELSEALKTVDHHKVIISDGQDSVTLTDPGSRLDLGAIAKGYCADKITSLLKEEGVTSAMVNLGGNVCVIGSKPDKTPFIIGIETPYSDRREISATAAITDGTIVTCGVYERYFEKDGTKYHHILDPSTGYPVDTDLLSVSVRSSAGASADCDALSTICLLLGYDKASELIEKKDGFEALFILKDNSIKTTSHFYPDH